MLNHALKISHELNNEVSVLHVAIAIVEFVCWQYLIFEVVSFLTRDRCLQRYNAPKMLVWTLKRWLLVC